MGVWVPREISRRNYDSARGAKPRGCYHNFWGIFLVVRTCPYINEFITWGNFKMNADRDAPTVLCPGACSLHTKWESHEINANRLHISATLCPTCSNSVLSRNLTAIFTHVWTCYEHKLPCYRCDRPCYEHHAPVKSIMPLLRASHPCCECHALLWACGAWLLQITHVWCLSSYDFLSNKYR